MAENCSIGNLKSNSYLVKPDIYFITKSDVVLNTLHLNMKEKTR